MTNFLSNESRVLLNLLANSLFDANIKIDLEGIDLEALFLESKSQTVLALAFDSLPTIARENNNVVYDKWQVYSFSIVRKNANQLRANAELETLFAGSKLPICTIKGFASNYYYNKKHLRQMGDIDFIVPAQKVDKYRAILFENGFECIDNDEIHDFHIAYKKNQEIYEMHKGITSFLDENGYINKYITDIFSNAVVANFGEVKITIPNVFVHGLIMLLHMQRHMIDGGGIGLRHLCDWAVFANAINDLEWKEIFEEKLEKINLLNFAKALSKVSSIYLGMPEKEWFCDFDVSVAEKLLLDIISGGNFGIKDIKRYQELFFISQQNNAKNRFGIYVTKYIKKVYSWNPFWQYHKVLLPIGMIAYFFRTIFLILFRNKKINYAENRKNALTRDNLYNNLFK